MKRSGNWLLQFLFVVFALIPLSGYAATTEFKVLMDTDNDASTGCTVTTPAGPFAGVEQVLTTTVDAGATSANVTAVGRQVCSAGSFGASVPVSSTIWPVGFAGESGDGWVESFIPRADLGTPVPAQIRVAFLAVTGASVDAIIQTPSATSLLWPPSTNNPRRHATNPGAMPQVITLDGQRQDWGSMPPFVPGGAGGPSTPHFINVYLWADTDILWFAFAAKLSGASPVANDDTYTVRQGKTLNVIAPGVLANDSDPNGLPLTPSVTTGPQHGTLALDPSGSFTYVNDGSSAPVDTFKYRDSNGTATSNIANVTVNVTADRKPIGVADNYSVPHGGTLTVPAPGVLANDSDPDGDSIHAVLVNGPQHGTLTLNGNGGFTYTHDGSNTLQDTFAYRAADYLLQSSTTIVTITIGPDAPPVAVNDAYTVAEGGTLNVGTPGLFANDSDPDTPMGQWTAQVVSGPANGTLTMGVGGAFTYVHNGSETLSDVFTYTINDGIQTGNVATVSITVTPVNDAPVAVADSYGTLTEDTPFSTTAATGVLANDTDVDTPHASLTAVLDAGPTHAATFALNPDGSFNYTPAANYNGTDSFTYHAFDGSLPSASVTVTLTIAAVNDPPSFTAGSNVSVNEDSGAYSATWATSVSAGPADESGQTLTFIVNNDNNGLFSAQPAINTAGLLTFTPAANANGIANVSVQLQDNGGGSNTSGTANFTITVVAVDDAPVNTVPGPQSINEDASFTFTGANAISVNDIDVLAGNLTVTLSAANGTLTLGSTAGLTVSGNGTGSVQATGTVAALNAGLNNTVYAPNANFSGSDTVTVTTNDNGNTGTGGPLTDVDTIAFTVNGVNDAPVITRPATATTNEDTPFTFSGGNVISVADVDAASGSLSLTLGVTNGTLTLSGTSGLTVSGNGTNAITASGTLANLNAALNGLIYAPSLDYSGGDTLNIGINDNGNTGSGGPLSDTKSTAITVNAVNDAPVAVADGYSTNEDTPLTVIAPGVRTNDSDVDTPFASLTAVLDVGPTNASAFTLNPDGSFNYTPLANFSGTDSFTYHVNDGSLDSNVVTVTITVNPVNDAPVITRPANISTNEDTPATFSGTISIADVDAASGSLALTLSVTNGTLTLSGTTGLTVSGNGTNSISASGTLANLNAALNGMSYLPSLNYSGSDTLNIGINDNGNTGSGGPLSDAQSTAITVNAVDDAPVNGVPGAQSVNEDASLTFSSGNGNAITVSDVDAGAGNLQVTLSSANGTITLGGTAGLTVSGNGTSSVQATGTIAALNAGLEGTVFTPTTDFSGSTSVDVSTSDLGNTGAGGPLTDNDSIAVTVNPTNDAPVITRPATATTNEDTPFTFSAGNVISIADVDAASGSLTVTLGVTNGTLTLNGTTGLTVSGDGTNAITASGTLTNLNNALNGLIYAPGSNYSGADTLNIGVNDNGNTGTGGPLTDSKSVAITVTAVDDSPIAVADGYSVNEDNPLTVNAASGVLANDTDVDTPHASLTAVLNVGPANASSFTLNPDGSFNYTPNTDFSGTDSFTYHAFDGNSSSNIVTVNITVNAFNDAPVITRPANISTNEDTPFTFNGGNTISIADVDAGGGSLSLTLGVTNGTLALNGTAGLTVSGDGTNAITASGTLANLNAALNGLIYTPGSNYSGADTLNIGINDNGNSGAGGPLSDSKSTSITVTAVNDAPVNNVPGAQSVNEDATLTFSSGNGNAITVSDVDAGGADVTVTLSSANGTITLGSTAGLTTVTGNGTGTVAATGPIATINTDLNGTTFTPAANFSGGTSVSVTTNDNGNTGTGGAQSDTDPIAVTVDAVDDAPVITRPATVSTNEDTTFTFNGGNTISIADVDAASGSLTVTLGVSSGVLTLSGTTGLTVSGNGTNAITASGNLTDLNNALNGMTYTPSLDVFGSDTLNIGVNDNGNTGTGGPLTDSKSTAITINAVNDAPVAVADGYSVNEDNPLTVNAASGVLANDTDVDTPHASLTAVLNVGPANASAFTLNSDGSFNYTPNGNFNGSDSFTYHAFDGALSSNIVTVTITVNAVDDAPVNTVPAGTQTMNQDSVLTFTAATQISISDVDAGANPVQVTLTATNGTVSLSGTAGLSFTVGDGTSDATMTFTGTIAAINTALNNLQFASTPGFFSGANATLNITTDDQGFTGAGGPLTDSDTIQIFVQQVNQAPVNTVPGAQSVNEDGTLTFSSGNGNTISTSDPDAGANTVQITIAVTNGVFNLVPTGGVTINNNGTATVTATGSITNLNTALQGSTYLPSLNFNGAATLTFTTNDLGNTGPGGAQQDTDIVNITVNAVNDAPVITRPATVTANEDQTFTFNAGNTISVADVDAASGSVTVTLSVTSGVLTLSGTTGLTVSGNGTNSITASGTLTNLNNALNGMTYLGNLNFNGGDTLNIGANDNGNTGSGGAQSDSQSTAITVTAVNDAPVNTVPGTQTFNEDTPLTFSTGNGNAISVADVDVASGNMTVTLTTTAGTMAFGSVVGLSAVTNNAATITGTGTLANINNALQGLVFTPTANINGAQTISVTISDLGNTGTGGTLTDTDPINLSITAVNDAPVITRPATFSVNEDTNFTFTGGNAISIADVDIAAGNVTVQLTVTQGTLTLSGTTGLAFTVGDGTSDATMTFSGTLTNVNNALNNATYKGNANYYGSDTLTINANDNGNTGSGGNQTDSKSSSITVNAVNDAPVAISFCASGCTNGKLPAQAGIRVHFPAGTLGGSDDPREVTDGSVITLVTAPDSNCANCTLAIAADGSFDFTAPPAAAGTDVIFTYHVTDSGFPAPGLSSGPTTVTLTVAGPAIYFAANAGAGTACTLVSKCTVAQAITSMGSNTNSVIFVADNATQAGAAITLGVGSKVIGQGLTGVGTFDSFFSINTSPGFGATLPDARPLLGQPRPTITGTNITLANNAQVRGLNLSATAGNVLSGVGTTGLVFTDIDISSNANAVGQFLVNLTGGATGTFNFGNLSVNAGRNGSGVNFNNASSGVAATFGTVTMGGTGNAVALATTGATNFTFGNITSSSGTAFSTNTSSGNFTFSNINSTTGTAFSSNTTSGNFTFNNVTSTTGTAVSITSSGAGTFSFNDVTSTTGTAVSATTGTGTLTFHKIAANGAVDGVTVNGAYTGFTVNGTAPTAGSGGTIQACTHNGIKIVGTNNISLNYMSLTGNGTAQTVPGNDTTCGGALSAGTNTGCVANLFVQNSTGVSIANVSILNSGQLGLNGNNVTNLTINKCTITGNGNEQNESGIQFINLLGTNTITDTNVKDNAADQIVIENASGSSTLTVNKTGGTIEIGNSAHPGAITNKSHGLMFNAHGTGSVVLQVDGMSFPNNFSNSINSNIQGTGSLNGYIQNCSFNVGAASINLQNNNSATIGTLANPFLIQNNPQMIGNAAQAINVGQAATATGSVFVKIINNTIGTSGVSGSACDLAFLPSAQENCAGITMSRNGTSGTFSATVTGNTIQQFGQNGITMTANNNAQVNALISGNIIRQPYFNVGTGHAAGNAIQSNIGTLTGGPACIDIKTNTITSDATFSYDPNNTGAAIYTRSRNASTVSIPGYAGGNNAVNVQTYVGGQNTFTAGFVGQQVKADNASGAFANGAGACSTP